MTLTTRKSLRRTAALILIGGLTACSAAKTADLARQQVGQKTVAIIQPHLATLVDGLSASQTQLQDAERSAITERLAAFNGTHLTVYLNRYGEVRWHQDAAMVGKSFDEFTKTHSPHTDAIEQSYVAKKVKSRRLPDANGYEIAVPIMRKDKVLGILLLTTAS